jgi:protein-tyrosine-phosphatase
MRGLTGALLIGACLLSLVATVRGEGTTGKTVVFVCEHGTVKSVIAMMWFNKLALERGLAVRAISRGVAPESAVPRVIRDKLAEDGLELGAFTPKAFAKDDLVRAARVVAMGVDTEEIERDARVPVESWNDIPPAIRDYRAARDAIRVRIERLLEPSHPPERRK